MLLLQSHSAPCSLLLLIPGSAGCRQLLAQRLIRRCQRRQLLLLRKVLCAAALLRLCSSGRHGRHPPLERAVDGLQLGHALLLRGPACCGCLLRRLERVRAILRVQRLTRQTCNAFQGRSLETVGEKGTGAFVRCWQSTHMMDGASIWKKKMVPSWVSLVPRAVWEPQMLA